MHYKFTPHGAGSGQQAVEYLLRDFDHKGTVRDDVILGDLSADPKQFVDLVDSLNFSTRYTSMVAGFHPDETPTDEQRLEVEREFDTALRAGMGDRVSVMHVWHREGDRWDYHALVAKVDLATGKSYNPAPPGWQKNYDPLRDYFNAKYGWKSPDIDLHPENARCIRPSHISLKAAREGATPNDIRVNISTHIETAVADGVISNRQEMIEYLQEGGFSIPRAGSDYITVEHPEIEARNNRVRLRGDLFNEQFYVNRRLETEAGRARSDGPGRGEQRDPNSASRHYRDFEKRLFKRTEYNINRYKQNDQEDDVSAQIIAVGPPREKPGNEASSDHVQTLDGTNLDSDGWDVDSDTFRAGVHGNFARTSSESGQRARDLSNDGHGRAKALRSRQRPDLRPSRQQLQNERRDRSYSAEVDGKATFKNQLASELLGGHVVFDNLKYVDVETGSILFNDGGLLLVRPQKITAENMTSTDAAERIIAGAKAEKWEAIKLTGSDDFFREAAALAIEEGIKVNPKNSQQSAALEEINELRRVNAARASVAETLESAERDLDEIGHSYERSRGTIVDAVEGTNKVTERLRTSNRQPRASHEDIIRKIYRMKDPQIKPMDQKNSEGCLSNIVSVSITKS